MSNPIPERPQFNVNDHVGNPSDADWAPVYEFFGIPANPGESDVFDIQAGYVPQGHANPIVAMAAEFAAQDTDEPGGSLLLSQLAEAQVAAEQATLKGERQAAFVGTSNLVGKLLAENKAQEMTRKYESATIDELTGLPNRRALIEKSYGLYRTLNEDDAFSVLFLDLDGLKTTNDRLGHAAGDILLKEFAAHITRHLPNEIIGRLGGDEFVVVLNFNKPEGIGDADWEATINAELAEIKDNLRTDWSSEVSNEGFSVGSSVGKRKNGHDFETYIDELLADADQKMYANKISRKPIARRSRRLPSLRFRANP